MSWNILSQLAELPPNLRSSYENIIFHSSWTGSNPDFQLYLHKYNTEIDELLSDGLTVNQQTIQVKCHFFIGDAPARAKACNSTQFNGGFGCLHCLHPTQRCGRQTLYPYEAEYGLRTNDKYLQQLAEASKTNSSYQGIKGPSVLSRWITLPERVIIDYMHLCLQGTFKSIIMNFFDSSRSGRPYYLGMLKMY